MLEIFQVQTYYFIFNKFLGEFTYVDFKNDVFKKKTIKC